MKKGVARHYYDADSGPFGFIEVNPETYWCQRVIKCLINEYKLPDTINEDTKFKTLLYHASRLGTCKIVVHKGYYCRDFIDDHSLIYCKTARPPMTRCLRLLFFNININDRDIFLHLEWVTPESLSRSNIKPIHGLIGTAIIRPTSDSVVGRTVFYPAPDDAFIPCGEYYRCHLYGTPMYVYGVPWLEQTQNTFVCGGAALWTCAFHAETRSSLSHYSPGELTALARKRIVTGDISQGMSLVEFPTAIREWGYQPFGDVRDVNDNTVSEIIEYIHCLIESRISVILVYFWLENHNLSGHAVTIFGHTLHNTIMSPCAPGEIPSTAKWIDSFIASDDQKSPYTRIPLFDQVEQPLGSNYVNKWNNESIVLNKPEKYPVLSKCKLMAIFAPFPNGVNITPREVFRIARANIKKISDFLDTNGDVSHKVTKSFSENLKQIFENIDSFALKPMLLELWDFHWKFKSGSKTFGRVAPEIIEYYLTITWPTWLWMVQIVNLHNKGKNGVSWNKSKVIGEILIDATASPRSEQASAFLLRLGNTIFNLENPDKTLIFQYSDIDVAYPLM